ncbi:MAG: menaquinone via futalosine step 1, partial [Campylobacter concisus]|nr:menaquinone via futalosine step 1 [Campylobacter concisus]
AQYAKSRDISEQDIKWYLKFISYKIGPKEQKSLQKFFKEHRFLREAVSQN